MKGRFIVEWGCVLAACGSVGQRGVAALWSMLFVLIVSMNVVRAAGPSDTNEIFYAAKACLHSTSPNCANQVRLSRIEQRYRTASGMGEYVDIAGRLETFLAGPTLDESSKVRALRLRDETKKLIAHTAAARQASALIEERKLDQVAPILATILGEASDQRSIALYEQLDAQVQGAEQAGIVAQFWHEIAGVVAPAVPAVLLLLLLMLVRWAVGWLRKNWGTRFTIEEISDESNLGVSDLIVSQLLSLKRETRASTAGLLLLKATMIPKHPSFTSSSQQTSMIAGLESLTLTIGTVNVGAIAKVAAGLWRWCSYDCRQITCKVIVRQEHLRVQLTARYPDTTVLRGRSCLSWLWASRSLPQTQLSTSVTALLNGQGDVPQQVAEEVATKMLYALAKDPLTEGEPADDVRKGLQQLRSYVGSEGQDAASGEVKELPTEHLKRAIARFKSARRSDPRYVDAYVYEGVALDLLEEHQDALERFRYARKLLLEQSEPNTEAKNSTEEDRKDRERRLKVIQYNEAVAHLRSLYSKDGIDKCIEVLKGLLETDPDPKSDPIIALAYAAKADAIACWTLHPVEFFESGIVPMLFDHGGGHDFDESFGVLPSGKQIDDIASSLAYKRVVEESVRLVTRITDGLNSTLNELKEGPLPKSWDRHAVLQLEWSIANALGDLYLYSYEAWVRRGRLPKTAFIENFLELALGHLNRCAFLFPPGVEILSNLGVLYFLRKQSGDLDKARVVLNEVTKLNPNYEYAYYRIAETYVAEQRYQEALTAVEQYKQTGRKVSIRSFGKLMATIRKELAVPAAEGV
jgi:tetratricopeptide (TPR) repeat protein